MSDNGGLSSWGVLGIAGATNSGWHLRPANIREGKEEDEAMLIIRERAC